LRNKRGALTEPGAFERSGSWNGGARTERRARAGQLFHDNCEVEGALGRRAIPKKNGNRWHLGVYRQVKSSSETQVTQRARCAHKKRGWYAPDNISLASCPSGRRSGWAVRRFDSLVLNKVADVVLCLCAQGEGAFLRIAPQRYRSPPRPDQRSPKLRYCSRGPAG
jgi:hypothetical protein